MTSSSSYLSDDETELYNAGKADGHEEILCDLENIANGDPVTDSADPWVEHLLWLMERIELRTQEKALREAAALLKTNNEELCAHWRKPEYAYCVGYYERNLRCPECPQDRGEAYVVEEQADACLAKLTQVRTKHKVGAVKEAKDE